MASVGSDLDNLLVSEREHWQDGPPHELFRALRGRCPVHWSPGFTEYPEEDGFWSVVTADDIHAVSRERKGAPVGHRGQIDRQHEPGDHNDGENPSEVVDRTGRLVDVAGDEAPRHVGGDEGERQCDEKHRAPVELNEQGPGDERTQRRNSTSEVQVLRG